MECNEICIKTDLCICRCGRYCRCFALVVLNVLLVLPTDAAQAFAYILQPNDNFMMYFGRTSKRCHKVLKWNLAGNAARLTTARLKTNFII